MTLLEAISARHSVRHYLEQPLAEDVAKTLQAKVDEVNAAGNLHIQLVRNEPKAYKGGFAYGTFRGVTNYFVMAGKKSPSLDERIGYYGEQLVLLAQSLGLNTCWTGLSYSKIKGTYLLGADEKIACYVALGYGEDQGVQHKLKTLADVSNADATTPGWFNKGVEAALLAPSALNQQKYHFEYVAGEEDGSVRPRIIASKGFSVLGYTSLDLGIAKCHFEIVAGKENFEWA